MTSTMYRRPVSYVRRPVSVVSMRAILLAIVIGHASAAMVAADPISLPPIPIQVTRGSVTLAPGLIQPSASVGLFGTGGFQLGAGDTASSLCDFGCAPGELVRFSVGVGLHRGTIEFAGQTLEFDAFSSSIPGGGSLDFTGRTFALPNVMTSVTFRSRFRMEGQVSVPGFLPPLTPDGDPIPVTHNFTLQGGGRATMTYSPLGDGTFRFDDARFDFAPVPEPGTFALLATGIAALCARRRSKNHAARKFTGDCGP